MSENTTKMINEQSDNWRDVRVLKGSILHLVLFGFFSWKTFKSSVVLWLKFQIRETRSQILSNLEFL